MLLLGVGVTAILLPLVQREQWQGSAKWLLIPVGLLLLAAFALWERRYARHTQPLFDLRLFTLRSYTLGALIGLIYFAGFTAIFFIFTLYLQMGLGYSALVAGLAITPFALGSAVASALGGRVVTRYGRPLVAVGLAAVVLGLVATDLVLTGGPHDDVPLRTALPLLVAGLGSGLVIAPNQTLTLSEVPVPMAGSGAGMLQTGQRIGSAAGSRRSARCSSPPWRRTGATGRWRSGTHCCWPPASSCWRWSPPWWTSSSVTAAPDRRRRAGVTRAGRPTGAEDPGNSARQGQRRTGRRR